METNDTESQQLLPTDYLAFQTGATQNFQVQRVILNTLLNNLVYFFILTSCLFTCVGFNYSVYVCVRTVWCFNFRLHVVFRNSPHYFH